MYDPGVTVPMGPLLGLETRTRVRLGRRRPYPLRSTDPRGKHRDSDRRRTDVVDLILFNDYLSYLGLYWS